MRWLLLGQYIRFEDIVFWNSWFLDWGLRHIQSGLWQVVSVDVFDVHCKSVKFVIARSTNEEHQAFQIVEMAFACRRVFEYNVTISTATGCSLTALVGGVVEVDVSAEIDLQPECFIAKLTPIDLNETNIIGDLRFK